MSANHHRFLSSPFEPLLSAEVTSDRSVFSIHLAQHIVVAFALIPHQQVHQPSYPFVCLTHQWRYSVSVSFQSVYSSLISQHPYHSPKLKCDFPC
ncbi:hypothetical protein QL285_049369 [Trifolium repens]|nr:hypothetical protein QL285_049369 [Trifolium repens]